MTQRDTNTFPYWTPDGERVMYLSVRKGGGCSIDWKRADGSGESESLPQSEETGEWLWPGSWSPDGETLVYLRVLRSQAEHLPNIWIASRDGEPEPRMFVATAVPESGPVISPDGEWLAYVSRESGRWEIYVQPFPDGGERHQISIEGGHSPVWSPDGQVIYYRNGYQFLAVPVTTKPRFRPGTAKVLFEGQYAIGTYLGFSNFDIAPDGKSFVMIKADEEWGRATEVRVVLNWFEELERLAPTSGN